MTKNNKFLFLLLGGLIACGAPPETDEIKENDDVVLDKNEEELGTAKFTGWRNEDGWEHRRCDMTSPTNVCAFSQPRSSGSKWLRKVKSNITGGGSTHSLALAFATVYPGLVTDNWVTESTTSTSDANILFSADESLYSGTPPNTNLLLSNVVHVGCNIYSTTLTETYVGSAFYCKQVAASIDVGAVNAWLNQWATTDQKSKTWASIYMHVVGVGLGLGSTDSGTTAMRRFLTKVAFPMEYSPFEICLLDSVNFVDPAFIDPDLGVYTNTCN